jgi:hypothetical protein
MADSGLGLAFRKLRELGFVPAKRKGATRRFEGTLACMAGPVKVALEIDDWDFVDYPTIRVLEAPASLPTVLPHVSGTGGLCYFTPGAVILDRYRPDHALWQCVVQARDVLDRLAKDPSYRQQEFQAEFAANWYLGQMPMPARILLGQLDHGAAEATVFLAGDDDDKFCIVSSHQSEIDALCRARGWLVESASASCWVIRSAQMPVLPMHGLPVNVGAMFEWIKAWDRTTYATIQNVLAQRRYLDAPNVIFVIQSAVGWFGFQIRLDAQKRKAYWRKPSLYRQHFHGKGRSHPIMRLAIDEIGADFIHSRNLQFATLKDRVVTVFGCGAIGGYLAQALAKLGAGVGTRGCLRLIDSQLFTADNAGRHLLGVDSLFKPKAIAVAAMLRAQFPTSRIEAYERSAVLPGDLEGDLVIDATGEEAFSEALNFHRLQIPVERRPAALHVWVAGNGECVQGLWVDLPKYACFRCLRQSDLGRTKRMDPLLHVPATRVIGCQAFTPYAVSAPMSASALAVDMVISWLRGDPTPRFRVRSVEDAEVRRLKNQNLEALTGCPACAPRF